jgi:hypothetical protein
MGRADYCGEPLSSPFEYRQTIVRLSLPSSDNILPVARTGLPSFRPQHRSTISTLYLHFVIAQANAAGGPGSDMGTPSWLPEARSVIQEYKSVLDVSTKFPRAGERNVLIEEYIDLCVAIWETSGAVGEHVGWVYRRKFVRLLPPPPPTNSNLHGIGRHCGGQPV